MYVNCCEKSELRTSTEANAVVKDVGKAGDIKIMGLRDGLRLEEVIQVMLDVLTE